MEESLRSFNKLLKNDFILTAVSGAVLAICFFPIPIVVKVILPYFLFIPLFFVFEKVKSIKQFFWIGFVFAFTMFLILLYWMFFLNIEGENNNLIHFGAFLLVIFVGVQYGVGFAITGVIKKRYNVIWPFALLFPIVEFWRGLGPSFGFQWGIIPLTQSHFPFIIQYADLIGVYGITFVILFVNYLIYKFIKTRKSRYAFSLIAIMFLISIYGALSINSHRSRESIVVGIVQPDVSPYIKQRPEYIKERFERLESMTEELADSGVNLIVWPETASPVYLNYRKDILKGLYRFVDSAKIPILTGTPIVDLYGRGPVKYYNGAMMLYPGDSSKNYKKMIPVPFVERMPYADKFSFMRKLDLGEGDYSMGKKYTVFSYNGVKFSVIICFESMFDQLSREFVRHGAEFLINITEDSWFGKTYFSYMHTSFLSIRAIENRRCIVRCANTGISGEIDQWGNMKDITSIFTKKALCVKIDALKEKTLYGKFGFYFPELLIFILVIYLLYPLFRRSNESRKRRD